MPFKKKLTMGAMSATLGLSLVAGGTWAAFNDVEDVGGSVAAGELDLTVEIPNEGTKVFNINDLKPGDTITRSFKLDNGGTLAIKDVLLSFDNLEFNDYVPTEGEPGFGDTDVYGTNSVEDYLEQFKVTLLRTGTEGDVEEIIVGSDQEISLSDLYKGSSALATAAGDHWVDGRVNLASTAANEWQGLPVDPDDFDTVEMSIEFVEYSERDDRGVEEQNKYQGDTADITFTLEARQWDGQDVSGEDGYVGSNEKANNGN